MRTDFRLYHGNDLEVLAGLLAAELARPCPGRALLAPDTVLVPQPAMRRWLQKALAERHGIAANLEFLAPGQFVQRALDANLPSDKAAPIVDAARMRWRLWRLLADVESMRAEPVFAPLRPLLAGEDPALAAWQLAGELAEAFEKYQAWRRDWLRGWDRGAGKDDWQAELWRRATRGLMHRGKRLDAYLARFDGEGEGVPAGLPARVFAFATQNVSPDVLRVIASSARAGTLHFYFLSPVRGWWGDLQTAGERLRADPEGAFADQENPLLRANGAAGRDFVRTLFAYDVVHPDYEQAVYAAPARDGLLQRLQRDLLERRPAPAGELPPAALSDPSLQVHACHTRLREVQVLHEQLRALLEADPDLQPREIAVLTPDIDQYAPFVEAVFGASDGHAAPIPFALTDASTIAAEPAAEAFARLLALPGARFAAGEMLALLEVPALAEKLQLDAADFERIAEWLRAAGVRWGLDAEHKAALGEDGERAFSWAWALDRLLLGHASGSDADVAGVAPLPLLESGGLALFDRFLQGLRALARWQSALAAPRAPAEWQRALDRLLEDFLPVRARETADRLAIAGLTALSARFAREAAEAGVDEAVPLSVLRAWFAAALADSDARQPFLTGGVTFGRMVPMRLVPFKVICLLGLDDGAFPRRDPPGSLNRLAAALEGAQRRVGDRSVRDDDRALFLQLLGAATQVFYLSYLGLDPRSGERNPPSVVVSELLDEAARQFADPSQARRQLVVEHPLQPFAAAAFGAPLDEDAAGDPRRLSFHAGWHAAATAALGARAPATPFARPLPPTERELPREWTRDQLLRALANPAREFLSARLGLRVPQPDERLPEDEPFDTESGLERWQRDERVLRLALASGTRDLDALAQRLLAEGRIPPGAAGRAALESSLQSVAPAIEAWSGRGPAAARAWSLDLGEGLRLSGVWPTVAAEGLRQFSASEAHGKTLLALGIDALAWAASGESRPIERIVRGDGQRVIAVPAAEAARGRLRELVAVAARAQREALAFMPKAGLAWLQAPDAAAAVASARKDWEKQRGGEGHDAWVAIALRGTSPFAGDQFGELARAVFEGLPGIADIRTESGS